MSNYTKTTNFTSKDSLPSGNANKVVKGAEFDVEFDAIATAVSTKFDNVSVVDINNGNIDNTVIGATTPVAGTFTALQATKDFGIGVASPSHEIHVKEVSTGLSSSPTILIEGTGGSSTNNATLQLNADGATGNLSMFKNAVSSYATFSQGSSGIQINDLQTGISMYTAGSSGSPDVKIDTTGNFQVLTGNLVASNNFTVDTNTFHVDSTNNRVGVGTTSPAHLLDIESSSSTVALRVHSTSGVDNSNPKVRVEGITTGIFENIGGPLGGTKISQDGGSSLLFKSNNDIAVTGKFTTFTSTGIDDNATSTAITIDSSEQVGIGTASPSANLHVYAPAVFGVASAYLRVEAELDTYSSATLQIIGNTGTIQLTSNASGNTFIKFPNLPTSDPAVAGQLWNDSGTLKISAG